MLRRTAAGAGLFARGHHDRSSHELGTAVDLPTPEMHSVIDQIGWKYGWGEGPRPGQWWRVGVIGGRLRQARAHPPSASVAGST
jgi:hypothetical protein